MKAREYATSGGSVADNETVSDAKVPCIWRSCNKKQKPNLQNWKGADTAAALLLQKSDHRQAALEQDNS